MHTVTAALSWMAWSCTILCGLYLLCHGRGRGIRAFASLARVQGLTILLLCLVVYALPVSKLCSVASLPLAVLVAAYVMDPVSSGFKLRYDALKQEAERTGAPLHELLLRDQL